MRSTRLTWERLAERLPLLNVAEVCRRAEIPLHRMDNAKRGRVALTEDELARIADILRQLNFR